VEGAGPPGPVGVRAARRGVGAFSAGVPRHGLQRARRLDAVRPLRGVQVSQAPSSSFSRAGSDETSSNSFAFVKLWGY
jgi:hypothetical protein